ncbi:MAG: hypothetical protein JWO49_1297 [Arthrobacter sp.]|nr:hypothetical protein [Arthrobacter sp.]
MNFRTSPGMPERPQKEVTMTTVQQEAAGQGRPEGTAISGPVGATESGHYVLRPVPFNAMSLSGDGHLGSWQELNQRSTIPHCVENLESSGTMDNLRRLDGASDAPFRGFWFQDSDIYKTLEAVAWEQGRSGEMPAADFLESAGRLMAKVQMADGYLNSFVQGVEPDQRWQKMEWSHELYTAGHLIQAAVAVSRATQNTQILDVARGVADLIVQTFGDGGTEMVDGHPEIETALVELYRLTGEKSYLSTASRQLELRGRGLLPGDRFGRPYFQDHLPIREAAGEATGHAVRQVYLATGIIDVFLETGDASLLDAAEKLWQSTFTEKAYLTGALGSRHRDEAFGDPYELPADRAYAETCAAIASYHWNWRMLLATGGGKYADEMERALYNAIAVSTSHDGKSFFYSNPLQLRTGHDGSTEDAPSQRLPWYACACCPPNLARLVASLHSYLATADDEGVQIHGYSDGELRLSSPSRGGGLTIRTATDYPWDGLVRMTVTGGAGEWTLSLRIQSWCTAPELTIDGTDVPAVPDAAGYVRLRRTWNGTADVQLRLPMPVRIVTAQPRVDAVRGCVALMRGPIVFCLEQPDQEPGHALEDLRIDPAAAVRVQKTDDLPGVPVVLIASGKSTTGSVDGLYTDYPNPSGGEADTVLTAIPYFRWANRGENAMRVWIPTI